MNKKLVSQGFICAISEVAYIAIVTFVMNIGSKLVGEKSVIGPVVFLTLIVTSVAVSGGLIFGRPVILFLEGKKKQSIEFFAYTIGWLAIILIVLLTTMYLLK